MTSTTATGGGAAPRGRRRCAAWSCGRQRRPGQRLHRRDREAARRRRPRRTVTRPTGRCPSPARSCASPTTSSVVGRPDWIAAVKPCGMTNAASASPASTAARAASSVATSVTSASPALATHPMTSSRSTVARLAAVEVDDGPLRVERGVGPDQPAEDQREPERRDDREDQRRPVAEPLPEVLGGDQQRDAHRAPVYSAASRRARPVRWRNTASRSGSTTSTRADHAPRRPRRRRGAGSASPRASVDEDLELAARARPRSVTPSTGPDRGALGR